MVGLVVVVVMVVVVVVVLPGEGWTVHGSSVKTTSLITAPGQGMFTFHVNATNADATKLIL